MQVAHALKKKNGVNVIRAITCFWSIANSTVHLDFFLSLIAIFLIETDHNLKYDYYGYNKMIMNI